MRTLIRSRRVTLPLAALALAGSAFAAHGAVAGGDTAYRTVVASTGDIDQELALSGVVQPSGQSDIAFGTSGTVAKVPVAQGDEVTTGEVIAVLDRAALRAERDRARADLAAARAQLVADRAAQTSSVTAASTSAASSSTPPRSTSTSSAPTTSGSDTSSVPTAVLAKLTSQQDAVLAAQTSASAALTTSTAALDAQERACAAPAAPAATTPSVDATSDGGEGNPEDSGATAVGQACVTALATVQSAQAATATAQSDLQEALEALGSTLTAVLGDVDSTGSGGSSGAGTPGAQGAGGSGAGGASGDTSGGSGSATGGGRTITAATLAQDQAAIDRATASLASVRADLAAAVVRAPADGTVVSLTVAPGDAASRGDTIATVVAPGLTTVRVQATEAQAAQLEQGMVVAVTPAGRTEELPGAVSRVDHIATAATESGAASATTYLVEIVLDDRDLGLPSGIPASVSVVVGSAEDVVVVPASAVVDGTVTVLEGGEPRRARVTTGIVGDTGIEVVDGVEDGARVVLADLGAELPTGDSDQGPGGLRIGGTGGGPGGAGGPGGGQPPSGGTGQRR